MGRKEAMSVAISGPPMIDNVEVEVLIPASEGRSVLLNIAVRLTIGIMEMIYQHVPTGSKCIGWMSVFPLESSISACT